MGTHAGRSSGIGLRTLIATAIGTVTAIAGITTLVLTTVESAITEIEQIRDRLARLPNPATPQQLERIGESAVRQREDIARLLTDELDDAPAPPPRIVVGPGKRPKVVVEAPPPPPRPEPRPAPPPLPPPPPEPTPPDPLTGLLPGLLNPPRGERDD